MICITGTPGTGKSTIMKRLCELGYNCAEVAEIAEGCVIGIENGEKIIDTDCMRYIAFDGIVVGHLSHHMKCDSVIVIRSHLKDIEKRLESRNYSMKKIMDNVESEAIDLIGYEAEMLHKGQVYEVMNEVMDETVNKVTGIIEGKVTKKEKIDITEEILQWY